MDKFDRIYALDSILRRNRYPASKQSLLDELRCSKATLERDIKYLREQLNAPLICDKDGNGYWYDRKNNSELYELPGLWFSAAELHALITVSQLLHNVQSELIDKHIEPIKKRIEKLLDRQAKNPGDISKRISIQPIAVRATNSDIFRGVSSALIERKQIAIEYHGRERDETTQRIVSPQHLIYYRDNWYLDAYCHQRHAMRNFALDRIRNARVQTDAAVEIEKDKIIDFRKNTYGILQGDTQRTAVLRFTPHRARWIADEQWHPQQQSQWLPDGRYELRVPYADPRELILDIMKYGPEVEVVAPVELRQAVAEKLRVAVGQYGDV